LGNPGASHAHSILALLFALRKRRNLMRNRLLMNFVHNINQFLINHSFKGSSRLKNFIINYLMSVAKGPTVVSTLYGFDIIVDPVVDKVIERAIYLFGTYEAGTLNIIDKCLRKDDTFIDVGSNIGLMSLFASQVIGKNGVVYSFEPDPETFKILTNNIEINRVRNILAQDIALGSSRNTETLYRNFDIGRGAASLIKSTQSEPDGINVSVQTLDEFLITNNISNVRMIKIDVEGWELEVLKGSSGLLGRSDAPIIIIEYSSGHQVHGGKLLDIYEYILAINNYSIYKLEMGKGKVSRLIRIEDIEDLPYHDNLFCFLPIHLENLPREMFA
jgi:FkbM family methyltransferase